MTFPRQVMVAIVGIAATLMPVFAASNVLNSTVLRRPFASNLDVECQPVPKGQVLRASSCREAHRLIPTSDDTKTFGLRGRLGVDVVTPWRWTSLDGNCIIEVVETSGAKGSYLDLSEAVEEMLELCVEYQEDDPEGSTATKIGEMSPVVCGRRIKNGLGVDGKLSLVMKSYIPTVKCGRPIIMQNPEYSNEILRKMPATADQLGFGRWRVPGVRVVLPLKYSAVNPILKAELAATVDVAKTNMETGSWYDIWSATVAILGMCVRQGKAGSAVLGDNGKMVVTIQERALKGQQRTSILRKGSEDIEE
ncbi:MAG: hypothetical protein Q9224_004346 [Gallowayella concinna]